MMPSRRNLPPARLALEDGLVLTGRSFGAEGERAGELVFHTAMCGYQEILTDPSYRGQIVIMTSPHVGNYGVTQEDEESSRPWVEGFVVREASLRASNFRAAGTLGDYLAARGVPAIEGLDTRMLTRRVREQGALRAVLTTDAEARDDELVDRARASPTTSEVDHVAAVTTAKAYRWTRGFESPFAPTGMGGGTAGEEGTARRETRPIPLAVLDLGVKRNILRSLVEAGFDVHVLPAGADAGQVREAGARALFLSNGPGDPALMGSTLPVVRALAEEMPVLGICLGHQILARVFGARTYKMKFGHHGANHPVKELATGRVEISSQNHSFAVDASTLEPGTLEVTHVDLNDGTVEGLAHPSLPVRSIQYHPEASPGPHDALPLFIRFRELVERSMR